MRTAPGSSVSAAAYVAAAAQAAHLGTKGGSWRAITDKPFQNDPVPGYRDPVWSNFGSGYGLVTGRISALTSAGGAIFAGGADGGVWKSTNQRRALDVLVGGPAAPLDRRSRHRPEGWLGVGRPRRGEHRLRELQRVRRVPTGRRRPHLASRRWDGTPEPQHLPHPLRLGWARLRGHERRALPAQRGGRRAVAPGAEAGSEPGQLAIPDVADHRRDVPARHGRARRAGRARLARRHAALRPQLQRLLRLARLGQGRHVPSHHSHRRHQRGRHRPHQLRRRRRSHLCDRRVAAEAGESKLDRRLHEPPGHLRLQERQPRRPVDARRGRDEARELGLGRAGARTVPGRADLVQPVHRGRPEEPAACVRGHGGGVRVDERRTDVDDDRSVLQLGAALLPRQPDRLPDRRRTPTSTPC